MTFFSASTCIYGTDEFINLQLYINSTDEFPRIISTIICFHYQVVGHTIQFRNAAMFVVNKSPIFASYNIDILQALQNLSNEGQIQIYNTNVYILCSTKSA